MTNEQKVGLFVLVGILLVGAAIEVTVGTRLFMQGYRLYVNYPNVGGLRTGDEVQVAGLKLGRVDALALTPDGVRVTLRLERDVIVRRDAIARLDYQALSGVRFVSISVGRPQSPALKDGDTIEGEVPPGITEMVDQLDGVAHSVRSLAESLNENQDRLLNNIDAMLAENRVALHRVLDNLDSISTKLDRGEGTMAKLLNDGRLYDRAVAVMADLEKVSDRLAKGEGDLGRLVNGDGTLYDEVRETVASLNKTAANLEEISTQVRNGEGTLGRIVTDDALYQEAQDAVRGLDRATAGIEDQSPISVLGTLVTTLF
jgi:phospholipid/cholesterol/gamma-HCH transport system substrate-binding protein